MPTYEYVCRDCGQHLEVVQSFKDDPLTICPACEGALRKVFSAAGIVFKGSGWHIKDYASSGKRAASAAGEGSTATSERKDGAKESSKERSKETSKETSSSAATSGGSDEQQSA